MDTEIVTLEIQEELDFLIEFQEEDFLITYQPEELSLFQTEDTESQILYDEDDLCIFETLTIILN